MKCAKKEATYNLSVEICWSQYPYTLLSSALPSSGQSSAKPESQLKSYSLRFESRRPLSALSSLSCNRPSRPRQHAPCSLAWTGLYCAMAPCMHSDLAGCQAAIDASPRKEQGHHLQAAQRGPVAATKTGFSVFSGPSKPQHRDHGGPQ